MSNQGYGEGELPGADRGAPKQSDIQPSQIAMLRNSKSRNNTPVQSERLMRAICIGADASVYEKNAGVSGTWYENRYPGCACDVPVHNYVWSFEPKLDWSGVYAVAREISKYFDDFKTKYRLDKYCKTNHKVCNAVWDDSRGKWDVKIEDMITGEIIEDQCDILMNASGVLKKREISSNPWPQRL